MGNLEPRFVELVCTSAVFRPCSTEGVRWLDWERDFELAREHWADGGYDLTNDEWLSFRDLGYTFCAMVLNAKVVSRAALYSPTGIEREVAAVWTPDEYQRRGYGKAIVCFVTREIVEAGDAATCHTRDDNAAMIATARSVGFEMRDAT